MTDSISPVSAFPQLSAISSIQADQLSSLGLSQEGNSGVSFQDVLLKTIGQVAESDEQTQKMIEEGLVSGDLNQAEIFISMKKTDLAYRTLIQVRNQAIDAYNELQQMRM